jgi:CheY-like chemotaxis protein
MILECAYCQKKLNTPPNANIPIGKPFTFICPSCKQKNTVTLEEERAVDFESSPPPPDNFPPEMPAEAPPQSFGGGAKAAETQKGGPFPPSGGGGLSGGGSHSIPGYNVNEVNSLLDLDDAMEGLKTALVIYDNEEIQNMLEDKLTNMGYKVSVALNVRDAAKQLKFGTFQVVLLQENYYGANIRSNQLLKAINTLEVRTRHKMFIGVIGPNFTSLDDLMAFSLSLDTVINTNDLDDIERLLISATGHVAKFFATYNELRAQRGVE